MQEQNSTQYNQEIKVSADASKLEEYQDSSGITIKKLDFGLWWITNVKFIKKTMFWFVVSLGIVAWLYTFISFGYYLTVGSYQDDRLLKEMVSVTASKQDFTGPANLQTGDAEIFTSVDGRFDFLATISNPNPEFYSEFNYSFTINGSSSPVQRSFIFPAEQKRITALGVAWPENVRTVQVTLSGIKWQRIDRHQIPDWPSFKNEHLAFDISEPQFSSAEASGLSEKINMSEISFTFGNSSPYNYYHLPLNIFLYSFDRIVGVYQTSLGNIASGEVRQVRLNYPGVLERVDRVDVVPDLNIIRPDIYFKLNAEAR